MAIGDSGNTNNNSRLFEYTYYSRMRISNSEKGLSLSTSFRSGNLILSINAIDRNNGFKPDTLIEIYLSPTKCNILVKEIHEFLEYLNSSDKIDPNRAFGVNAGMGEKVSYIAFHATEDKVPVITIGKFDGSGTIIDQASIELNVDYHYGLEWNDLSKNDLVKSYHNSVEIEQLKQLFIDYSTFMNGAAAYAHADLVRYDLQRVLGKMDPIYDKLGIERRTGGNSGFRGTNNFLNNSNSSSNKTSIDNLEDELDM